MAARAVLSTRAASPVRFAAAGDCVPGGANKTCVRPACSVFAALITGTRALRSTADGPRWWTLASCPFRATSRDSMRGAITGSADGCAAARLMPDVGELVEQRSRLTVPIRLGLLRPGAADEPGDDAADDDHCDQDEQPGVAVVVFVSRRSGDRRGRPCRVRRRCRVGRGGGGRCGRRWRRGRGWRRRRGLGRRRAGRGGLLRGRHASNRADDRHCEGGEQYSNGARHARDRTRPSRLPRPPPQVRSLPQPPGTRPRARPERPRDRSHLG